VVIDTQPVPLAFAPAFVPVRSGAAQGSGGGQENNYVWVRFDPKRYPSQQAVLPELDAVVSNAWSWE
jgi:hypothetical protein